MRIGPASVALYIGVAVGILTGCSSTRHPNRKPAVAITISASPGARPSPSEIAEIHTLLQPEIEKRGYVMAKSSRSADYFVHVRFPVDPLAIRNLTFVEAPPTVPFLKDSEWQPDVSGNRDYKRAIADMVREPK
jgi:hypothetical protein